MTKVITNYTKNEDGSSGGRKPYPPSWSMTNNSKLFNVTWEKLNGPLNYSFTESWQKCTTSLE